MTAFLGSLQLRRKTAAQWSTLNPILTDRELAFENDTKQAKLGDGVTTYNLLPYYSDPIVLAQIQTEITNRIAGDAATLASANSYSDSILTNLWKDQGSFTPSGTYPIAADTTPVVATIKRGFVWVVSGLGSTSGIPNTALVGTQIVNDGDLIRALVTSPGQTDGNWGITEHNLGYTAENIVNKSTDIETDKASNVKYAGVKAVYDWAVAKFLQLTSVLTGFAVAGTRANIAATDSILIAFGKTQKFFNDLGDLAFLNRATIAEINAGADSTKIPAVDTLKASGYLTQGGDKIYAAVSGTNTYTASLTPAITAYSVGQMFLLKFTNANTGAATINLNTLGAVALVKNGAVVLVSGDIPANGVMIVMYDGTNFQVLGSIDKLSLSGTGVRVVEADAGGTASATKTIIDQIVTDSTLIAALQTAGSWTGTPPIYNSSALGTPGFQGQIYFGSIGAISYLFLCKQDGLWSRQSLSDIRLPAEGGTGINATILTTVSAMIRINATGTAFENSGLFFNQSLRTNDSPTFVSFTMAGNLTLGLTTTASVTANQNNYAGLSVNNIFRFSASAAWNITGLTGGTLGRVYVFTNVGSFNLTFTNEDGASTAANRFNFSSGVNMILPPLATIIIYYDSTTSRWRDMAYTGGVTHIIGVTAAPAIAAGAGAGTTPTVALVGNDVAGKITVTTGTLPTAAATVVTVTFAVPYASGAVPRVVLSAHNALAAALSGVTMVFAAGESNTVFTITAGATGLAAATAYEWNYHVIQ